MSEKIKNKEVEVDFYELVTGLWSRRNSIIKCAVVGIIVGIIVAFSIPREFVSSAKLAPEKGAGTSSSLGSLGGLAAMAGISTNSLSSGGDAISTNLYPEVIYSFPFIAELFDVEVATLDGGLTTDLYTYIFDYEKVPWWSHVKSAPIKLLGAVIGLFSSQTEEEEVDGAMVVDLERPTRNQDRVYKSLRERISVSVDTKTFVITVNTKMQDPNVALEVTKIVIENLKSHITNYRTQKVKTDLEYALKAHQEAKDRYYEAQQKYAIFQDENKNISSSRYRTELERLGNDMSLAFSLYTTLSSNLEQTKLLVQQETPVCVVIVPPSRPIKNVEPNKLLIMIAFILLAGVGSVGYFVIRDRLIKY